MTFTFKPGLSKEREEDVLSKIGAQDGVMKTTRLKPNAKDASVRLMAFVYVDDKIDPEALVAYLSKLPEIESASVPTPRRLIT